ncbi:MAG: L,D-transpeptidase [Candidatus Caenarcaniphilales bacterium]|nr:L,D-transpeptidase [Candidatus Caenarcaniphilales bacterium]
MKQGLSYKAFFIFGSIIFTFCVLPSFSYRINREIKINVPSRSLQIFQAGKLIQEYPVGVGNSKQFQTPPGIYKVEKKIINPIWEHPYKPDGQVRVGNSHKNPLGSRWIGFHKEGSGVYGIHGTNEPSSIGKFVSHGCVRMHNEDVEEIFDLVSIGTKVTVTYKRFVVDRVGNTITLEVFPDPYQSKNIRVPEVVSKIRKIHPFAQIDFELLNRAINDTSDSTIYEIASINYKDLFKPYRQKYNQRNMRIYTQPYYLNGTYMNQPAYYVPSLTF